MKSVLALIGMTLSVVGCSIDVFDEAVESREEKQFTVTGPVTLSLNTFDGSVAVSAWDRNEVRVEIERRAESEERLKDLDVTTTQEGNRIVVNAREPRRRDSGAFGFRFASVSLIVTVPRSTTLDARTGDGSVTVDELIGTARIETGDGSIRLSRVEGDLDLRTGDGSVDVAGVKGQVDVQTGDGAIQVVGVLAGVTARSGDGSIRIEAEGGSVAKRDWRVATGDGAISVRLPPDFSAEVEARSGDGSIRIDGIAGSSDRRDDQRAVSGRLGAGGQRLILESGDGSIDVTTR